MHPDDQLQVIEFLYECTGVRVPLHDLPEVLGPTWFEVDGLDGRDLSDDEGDIVASCLLQTLLGVPLSDEATDEELEVLAERLYDAAAMRGWETDLDDGPTLSERVSETSIDTWLSAAAHLLPDAATTKRTLGHSGRATVVNPVVSSADEQPPPFGMLPGEGEPAQEIEEAIMDAVTGQVNNLPFWVPMLTGYARKFEQLDGQPLSGEHKKIARDMAALLQACLDRDRTDEVLGWYTDVSGVVLSEADLKQLTRRARRRRYRLDGLDFDTPALASRRARRLASWLVGKPWPKTKAWDENAAFVMKLQAAALSRGLGVEPERWRWKRVKAFQEGCRV